MPAEEVPSWDGDPSGFEAFATSCRWYEASLKDNERKLAAPRIWQRLAGAAKSVVCHLDPKDFGTEAGLNKLLGVLRESPLQKLPVPDSFNRLERWSGLRRTHAESIPQLLVREEELFVELQQALQRARAEKMKHEVRSMAVGAEEHDPPTSPSRSPTVTFRVPEEDEAPAVTRTEDRPTALDNTGFFENELRGYRLLKAAKLSAAERQHVMTLTKNSAHFQLIRRALRSLFADFSDGPEDAGGRHPRRTVWHTDDAGWDHWDNEQWVDDGEDWWDEEAHWNDWSPASTWEYYDEDYEFAGGDQVHPGDEGVELTAEEQENEKRLEEAFVLAGEANRTLAEAKQAVAKVRAARGYYSPMGMKGKGRSSKGKKGGSNGKGKGHYGSMFHLWHDRSRLPEVP